jgi:two-component system sensor histidine kinase PilS (NtrC family)
MRLVFDAGQNFSAFLSARLIFVTVLLAVGALFRPPGTGWTPYLALFAANTVLSLGGWEWYRSERFIRHLKWLTLTLAVVLDTLVLYYTGRTGTLFVFLYFFSVGAAGLLTGWIGSLWTALLCVAGMTWLTWEQAGKFDHEELSAVFVYALNFLLLAVLSSYIHSWFRHREHLHRKTLGELQQTRLDTQAILDSLSTGVIVVNAERQVLYSNPRGRAIVRGERPFILGEALHREAESEESSPSGAEWTREIELNAPDGRRIIGCVVTPLQSVAGELRGHVLLLSDLTPLKEAERAERERERLAAIGMLSRDLAHEIRNPLATVRGCVEMIRDEPNEVEKQRFLDLALKESDRLNNLLRDFLTFAQIDTPKKQMANFTEFLRHRLPLDLHGVTCVDRLPERLDVAMDPDQLGMVVDAMILSLAEWAEGQGEIRLEAGTNGMPTVRFLLTKKTVPAEYKEAVFQPFSSVNRANHGLALPTALRAVHAHGGWLTLETEPGVGTWFDLKL